MAAAFELSDQYRQLGDEFSVACRPQPVRRPELIVLNHELLRQTGQPSLRDHLRHWTAVFAGNRIALGSEPVAMAYAGHQFGQFVPRLGDGRALLLGEIRDASGTFHDLQLKGSGRTPFSRNGDGRAALGPVLREYLVSEAMHALGVPTTRALAAVNSGETVQREHTLPGAIITRLARSFVRVGSFQYLACRENYPAVEKLVNFCLRRLYPEIRSELPALALLEACANRQAKLISQWLQLGFIHGVMNTDNMAISGETLDYGPCAFMDSFNPSQVYSYIDRQGRYAYNQQARIGLWNLARMAETLLPLLDPEPEQAVALAEQVLHACNETHSRHWLAGMRAKIGLRSEQENDDRLINRLLEIMHHGAADYTLTFYRLSQLGSQADPRDRELLRLFRTENDIRDWLAAWRLRLQAESRDEPQRQAAMRTRNPAYIPRNHLLEKMIRDAEDNGDFSEFHHLLKLLQRPFTWQKGMDRYMRPPRPEEVVAQTFCGT